MRLEDVTQFNLKVGASTKPLYIALGVLRVEGNLGNTDRKTVEQIIEKEKVSGRDDDKIEECSA